MRSLSLDLFRLTLLIAVAGTAAQHRAEAATTVEHQVNGRPVALQVAAEAAHRAIFCGAAGTETSVYYSRALAGDLDKLRAAGLSDRQAFDYIHGKICGGEQAVRTAPARTR